MPHEANNETNQDLTTIHLPDQSDGVENPPEPPLPQKPDEHVPPLEVLGRQDTPEPIPEKSSAHQFVYPILVKNGKKKA